MPTAMGTPALLWIALLLFSPDGISAAIWKSKVSLNPPWNRVFRGENVTLTCRGNNSLEDDSTLWIHNKNPLEVKTSRWDIVNASIQDNGEYRCQNKGVIMSEPVYLDVISDWLLLQASAEMVLEGEHLFLRCHGWRNLNVYKVTYFKNDKALKYWYENHNISITNATTGDSGTYYCMGTIQQIRYTSNHLIIKIQKGNGNMQPVLRAISLSDLFHSSSPKQIFLATISYPIVGEDSVCCGHMFVYLDPAAVHISLED
ncbi:high affinity immunoglobulin epsilon receptor subunit alpha isoform X2 [Balaenoptera ricei]|uniref:high affinity immunoglobulin epsilon receptor subunit alpha isoform X2 n=1 Tax=Balaenoptera ricei TaxID=2746895 RepID=UPI0028BDEC4F|nr:high affinity immunoglobulin epsilon receptor subunit alpha isoform X2 [Balaenoptera ricei]